MTGTVLVLLIFVLLLGLEWRYQLSSLRLGGSVGTLRRSQRSECTSEAVLARRREPQNLAVVWVASGMGSRARIALTQTVIALVSVSSFGCTPSANPARWPEGEAASPRNRTSATDSAQVVRIASDTILALIPDVPLKLARFQRLGSEFVVGLIPLDSTLTGGGGVVRVSKEKRVISVVMEQ